MSEEITRHEQIIRDLQQKIQKAEARRETMSGERAALGYALHVEGKSRKPLDGLNAEEVALKGEIESLTGAMAEATARLDAAKASARSAQDREAAKKLRAVIERAAARALEADARFAAAVAEVGELFNVVRSFNALGEEVSYAPLLVNFTLAVKTALMDLPSSVARDFEFLAPAQRRTFSGFLGSMVRPIEVRIKARLGEKEAA